MFFSKSFGVLVWVWWLMVWRLILSHVGNKLVFNQNSFGVHYGDEV